VRHGKKERGVRVRVWCCFWAYRKLLPCLETTTETFCAVFACLFRDIASLIAALAMSLRISRLMNDALVPSPHWCLLLLKWVLWWVSTTKQERTPLRTEQIRRAASPGTRRDTLPAHHHVFGRQPRLD